MPIQKITSNDISAGAALVNLGYTPVNKSGDVVTGQLNMATDGYGGNWTGQIRISPESSAYAGQWGGITFPSTTSGTSSSNNLWMIGRGGNVNDRLLSIHIPSYSDYSSTGTVPYFGVFQSGADPLLTVNANGVAFVKNGIQRPDLNGCVISTATTPDWGLWFDTDSSGAYGPTKFTTNGYYSGDMNVIGFIGSGVPRWSVSLNNGGVFHWFQRVGYDRNWDNYPTISVCNDTINGPCTEFRVHGQGGASGGDFSVNFRVDGSYITGSDRRRKTNLEDISNPLDAVLSLKGVKYNTITRDGNTETNLSTDGKKFGFIAQDCIDVIPEAVIFYPEADTPNANGWASAYSVDYGSLTALLVEAIKEQQSQIDDLKQQVISLSK